MRRLDDAGARVTESPMRNSPEGEHMGRNTKFNRRQYAAQTIFCGQWGLDKRAKHEEHAARTDLVTHGKGPQASQQTDELQDVDQLGSTPIVGLDGPPLPS